MKAIEIIVESEEEKDVILQVLEEAEENGQINFVFNVQVNEC